MSVSFKIRSSIKRAIETGELLYVDYVNKNEDNTFYFFGIKNLKFNGDESKLTGSAYNYQYIDYIDITIELNRIKDARCVEGTKNLFKTNIKKYMKVPNVNNYFTEEINEKHILDYYSDCIENSNDLAFVSTFFLDSFDLDTIKESQRMSLDKEDVDSILKLLNINEDKVKEKYKLAFNVLSIANFDLDVIPLVYLPIYLNVFDKEIFFLEEEFVFHQNNISKLLKTPDIDVSIYENHIDQLREDIDSNSFKPQIYDENPQIFKLKLDLSLSPRKDFQKIKDIIYSKKELTPVLKAFFGKYEKPVLSNNKNIYFVDNKVNADQVMATYSVINNDLTYVQGPPGTGKSATIVNMIVSSMLNNDTTLVTSYTNAAVDNIYNKLRNLKYKQYNIPIPMIRLGSQEYARKGIRYIKNAYLYYQSIIKDINLEELRKEYKALIPIEVNKLLQINSVIDANTNRKDVETKIDYYDKLIEIFTKNKTLKKKVKDLKKSRTAQKGYLTRIEKKTIDNILDELNINFEVILLGIFIKSLDSFQKLEEDKYAYIKQMITSESYEDQRSALYKEYTHEANLRILQQIFPVFLTTNISSRSLPDKQPTFDLLIMDEAGQCENAYAIVAMSKASRAAFIGDPNQLLPVVTISDTVNNHLTYQYSIPDVYNYKKTSILQTLNQIDFINDLIILKKHYRCRKSIVNFANKKYYNNRLDIQVDQIDNEDCKFIDVKSEFYNNKKNTSLPEVIAIIEELKKIPPDKTIGVISPFRNQTLLINKKIKEELPDSKISVGTVHKFQGQEKDVILLSLAVGGDSYKGSYDWIKDNRQLINVATTRPKERLVVVGDKNSINTLSEGQNSDLKDLIEYTSQFNKETFNISSVGKKYGDITSKNLYTNYEDMFFDTLQRVLEINTKGFRINGQTDVKQVLNIHEGHPLFEYATKASFDFLIIDKKNNVRLAIELGGAEHKYDPIVISRDKVKKQLADEKGLEIIYINNRDARRYKMLKDILKPLLMK
ncbi:DUF2726 domain-containing protein [Hujiaoplasma nucleasis]|uniref:DUF2726 domain-containing protein n=1 Tax=Hujiaoplasma nucleasis TaxID=2725268 RepID=A0A7L6N5V3_9MOLU|nr:AAA domain-containing protein [Hujiaoplasma nucleasis]QLY40647.1 DUF2726 domain-containing protein [Hujiaoplasma nucleasis]